MTAAPSDPTAWHRVDVFNNMIVNNVAGYSGGGISMVNAANVRIIHNTIANNDSAGTTVNAFPPGTNNQSSPQIAGVASYPHSPALAGAFAVDPAVAQYSEFSNPELADNVIWHNRSFYFLVNQNNVPVIYHLVPDISVGQAPVSSDLGVVGGSQSLQPVSCLLTDSTGTDPSNVNGPPAFIAEYSSGAREVTTVGGAATSIVAQPAFDEPGNFIRLRYGPLTLAATDTGDLFGDYHIGLGSAAIDTGVDLTASNALLLTDFDGGVRPVGVGVDMGADESGSVAALKIGPQAVKKAQKRALRKAARKAKRDARRKAKGLSAEGNRKPGKRAARRAAREASRLDRAAPRHGGMFIR